MLGKRRRTQLNYRSIAKCNLTNKVIRFMNAETQTSPAVVVSQLYVAVERMDDRIIQAHSNHDDYDTPRQDDVTEDAEDQRASIMLEEATGNNDSLRNSFPMTLETSQENQAHDSLVQVNFEDKEVDSENPQLPPLDNCEMSSVGEEHALKDSKPQMSRPVLDDINSSTVHFVSSSSSSDKSLTLDEESQANVENDLEDNKAILRNSLPSLTEENISRANSLYLNNAPIVLSRSNRNTSNSSSSEEEEEEDDEEENDTEEANDRERGRKKQNKYIRINAHTVHIHNHFYKN